MGSRARWANPLTAREVMNCPKCQALIPAEDVNLETLWAKCRNCDEVFSFAESAPAAAPPRKRRLPAGQPEGFRVEELGQTQRITRRWFMPQAWFLIFFCLAWDSFLVFWYSMAFAGAAATPGRARQY
jgi:hypothetical protein